MGEHGTPGSSDRDASEYSPARSSAGDRSTTRSRKVRQSPIRAAAVGEGISVGAWCSSVSLRAAREQVEPLDADWRLVMRELMALRRQARTIGGLLNQVAAAWNSTGVLAPQAGRVLGMVERVVTDVDVVTARARARLR
jgi:hypothetical protein